MLSPARDDSRDVGEPDAQTLIVAIRNGDRAALARLHELYSPALYRFVYYRLGGRETDVEEIVQETFLTALKSLRKFRGESAIFTWLCGIARHLMFRTRRQQYRDRLAVTLEQADQELDRALAAIDEQPLADQQVERAETQDLVGATLASLPPAYQHVLTRKYFQDLPVEKIAQELGTSHKALESTLARARAAFRTAWKILAQRLAGGCQHG
jgi:RNA polymerase sigma-70 factor (ECF subfamily)